MQGEPHEHLTTALWRRTDDDSVIARRHDGEGWAVTTWPELAERVRAVAAGLVASEPGDAVAIMSPTRLDWTVAEPAVLAAGGVTVPLRETDSAGLCPGCWVRWRVVGGG